MLYINQKYVKEKKNIAMSAGDMVLTQGRCYDVQAEAITHTICFLEWRKTRCVIIDF